MAPDDSELTADILQGVLEQAQTQGSLTIGDVSTLVLDADLSPAEVEFLYSLLGDLGVEVDEEQAEELEDFSQEEEFLASITLDGPHDS